MSTHTVHLGLLYIGRYEPEMEVRAPFVMDGDSMAVWGEPAPEEDTGPRHVTVAHDGPITWEQVQQYRVMLWQQMPSYEQGDWHILDYAFVTDYADWSKDCRTWLLTERNSLWRSLPERPVA